ncbi:MAG: hypothetical protein RLZZ511_310 [Cyanobacteriota bacterium]|jgi:ABC-type maltose transport system permease subunit
MTSRSLPRSITIFGFTNTALGAGGLITGLSALIKSNPTVAENVYQQVNASSQSLHWLNLAMILSPISSLLLLLCGIGLLRKKRWGRTLAIYYGYGSIAFSVIASAINIFRFADRINEPLVLNTILGIVLSVLLGLAYKAFMVYSLSRESVKVALVNQPIGAEILEFPQRRR